MSSSSSSSSSSSIQPITLKPGGPREIVDATKAKSIISSWKSQLQKHKSTLSTQFLPTSTGSFALHNTPLCNSIDLHDKSYTAEAAQLIADFVTTTDLEINQGQTESQPLSSYIQYADLSDIIAGRMEEEGLQVLNILSNAFVNSPLITLDLSDNAMGSKGVIQVQALFESPIVRRHLKQLSFCNNGLSEYTMAEVANLVTMTCEDEVEGTCIASQLTKIHFFNNMSGDEGCTAFAKILDSCSDQLVDIRFSGTRAKAKGSLEVSQALERLGTHGKLVNLQKLDLADNTFGDCFTSLSKSLVQSSKLQTLNVRDCVLKDEGIIELCSTLQQAECPLTFLDVSGNEIEPDGAKKVASLLPSNPTLQTLLIEENEMTSKGVKYLARAIASMPSNSIQSIDISSNECGKVGGTAFVNIASKLTELTCIKMDLNMFPKDVVEALTDAYGDKLPEMEDNDDDDDVDEDYEDDSEDEVDDITGAVARLSV